MPAGAVPHDVLRVDGANKELKDKLPMAHTEQDVTCSPEYICCLSTFIAVCEKYSALDSNEKCCQSKAEAEDRQVLLWVFNEFGGYIGIGNTVDSVKYHA